MCLNKVLSIPFYIAHGYSSPLKESKNKANEDLETATEDITYPEDDYPEDEDWDKFPKEHQVEGDEVDEEDEGDEVDEYPEDGEDYPSMEEKDENIEESDGPDKDSKKCQG